MSNKWIVVIFLLFLVIMLALIMGSQNYNGFAFAKSTLTEYPYEGFAEYQETFKERYTAPVEQSTTQPATTKSGLMGHAIAATQSAATKSGLMGQAIAETKPREGFETMTEPTASKLSGSTYGDEKPVAFLYNNDANTTCKNYGYTNSKGFICMSASDIQLLTTRGGNAAGASDQIGK